jgi:hypothetical protein
MRKYSNVLRKGEIMGRWTKKIKNKQYGQAMAEFALTLPIFLLLVFGVIELSRFFLVYSSVYTASREASRYGASVGKEGTQNFMNCSEIINTAVRMGNFGGVQADDVTVYYEESPTSSEGEKVVCDGVYEPKLGERLVVEIVTEFDSLLGIVPDLPVRAVNGRTIMMNIIIERTPEPIDKCEVFVSYEIEDPTKGVTDNILFVRVKNASSIATYTIYRIENVDWIDPTGEPKLLEVRWSGETEPIWVSEDILGSSSAIPFTIPGVGSIDYWNQFLRNLNPLSSADLEFIFNQNVDPTSVATDIDLEFELLIQHAYLPSDICNPGE